MNKPVGKGSGMEWAKLLGDGEFDGITPGKPGDGSSKKKWLDETVPYEKCDYQEIISSPMFRALQDKTQMMALDSTAMTRTRLTHSLEVSGLADLLIPLVNNKYREKRGELRWSRERSDGGGESEEDKARRILVNAGLLHDLGNPPFGHEAEEALGEEVKAWCEGHPDLIPDPVEAVDLSNVQGNSQALRYLIHANPLSKVVSNPTYALAAAITKYTVPSADWNREYESADQVWRHKPGCYMSEHEEMERMWDELGIPMDADGIGRLRHPLAYLLEAVDDISYKTSDCLDAYISGKVGPDDFFCVANALEKKMKERGIAPGGATGAAIGAFKEMGKLADDGGDPLDDLGKFNEIMREMRYSLLYNTADEFVFRHDDIMSGKYHGELLSTNRFTRDIVKQLESFPKKRFYVDFEVRRKREQGKAALRSLFRRCVRCINPEDGRPDYADKAITERLKEYFILAERDGYLAPSDDGAKAYGSPAYRTMRVILDYLSSLTDGYVLKMADVMELIDPMYSRSQQVASSPGSKSIREIDKVADGKDLTMSAEGEGTTKTVYIDKETSEIRIIDFTKGTIEGASLRSWVELSEKEAEVARNHMSATVPDDGAPVVFVDGSFFVKPGEEKPGEDEPYERKGTYGSGIAWYGKPGDKTPESQASITIDVPETDPDFVFMHGGNDGAEAYGPAKVLEKAKADGLKKLTIVYDGAGVCCWALGLWSANKDFSKKLAAAYKEAAVAGVDVTFVHVTAHRKGKHDTEWMKDGNGLVDDLAAYASGKKKRQD